jgi:hypothetical protein
MILEKDQKWCSPMCEGTARVHLAVWRADSGGGSIRFEQFGEYLAGFLPSVDLTGSIVDLSGDRGEIVRIAGDLHALGKYSRTIRLRFSFAAPLPRRVRMSEVHRQPGGRDILV